MLLPPRIRAEGGKLVKLSGTIAHRCSPCGVDNPGDVDAHQVEAEHLHVRNSPRLQCLHDHIQQKTRKMAQRRVTRKRKGLQKELFNTCE